MTVLGQEGVHRPAGTRWPTNAAASNNSRFGSDVPCTPPFFSIRNENPSTLKEPGLLSRLLGAVRRRSAAARGHRRAGSARYRGNSDIASGTSASPGNESPLGWLGGRAGARRRTRDRTSCRDERPSCSGVRVRGSPPSLDHGSTAPAVHSSDGVNSPTWRSYHMVVSTSLLSACRSLRLPRVRQRRRGLA